jgi:hypothetical protein
VYTEFNSICPTNMEVACINSFPPVSKVRPSLSCSSRNLCLRDNVLYIHSFVHSFIHPSIHPVVCLMTCSMPFPKRVLHRARSSASSFNLQYLLLSFRSFSSCLLHLPRLPVMSSLFSTFSSITCFRRQNFKKIRQTI